MMDHISLSLSSSCPVSLSDGFVNVTLLLSPFPTRGGENASGVEYCLEVKIGSGVVACIIMIPIPCIIMFVMIQLKRNKEDRKARAIQPGKRNN
jgi:hypothetical protein